MLVLVSEATIVVVVVSVATVGVSLEAIVVSAAPTLVVIVIL
jgi:hypothetical protein